MDGPTDPSWLCVLGLWRPVPGSVLPYSSHATYLKNNVNNAPYRGYEQATLAYRPTVKEAGYNFVFDGARRIEAAPC